MTANSAKKASHCLICNSKVGVSTRNSVRIFDEALPQSGAQQERLLIETICCVLKRELDEESVHSAVVCKKCYKLFIEVRQ